ncbi:MAG: protein adenylyltransferase SelO family protein [Bdellovibrio sp.]
MSQPSDSVNTKALLAKNLLELGPEFYDAVKPAVFPESHLRYWNQDLVDQMGWTAEYPELAQKRERFQEFKPFPSSLTKPLALRYHGHQFQHYNPDLGDGRGFLYAQVQWQGKLWDFGTKGSGTTPYSRRGDGRLTLKGAFRESLATELLEAVGVNTSRTFCFFETGEPLTRGDEPSPTRSAVLTRFSHSHIRIGTFQRLAYFQNKTALEALLRYSARHLITELDPNEDTGLLAVQFLKNVSHRLAHLTAQWMIAGFVHAVLNTDNLNITGESFDYGPYRFLPHYDPGFTAAYFDHQGLYAFGRQPQMVLWAVQQLASSLEVLVPELPTSEILADFGDIFSDSTMLMFLHKLNLKPRTTDENNTLLRAFFHFQEAQPTKYEQTFFDCCRRNWNTLDQGTGPWPMSPQAALYTGTQAGLLLCDELKKFAIDSHERGEHPLLQRAAPVTLLIDEIEALWAPIDQQDDWGPYNKKLEEIRSLRALMNLKTVKPDYFGPAI